MADAKQNKNKSAAAESSSEGFGFKQSPLGFDKNEVNLYINKLKKQMKEQQIEFDTRIKTLEINLQNAQKETNDAKNAQRAAEQASGGAPAAPAAAPQASDESKKIIENLKEESDKKIMELRKLVLDERRNVAKLDKECASAQMSEKRIREEYEKLKNRYLDLKKAGSGGKAVATSNAAELLDEAAAYAEEIINAAKAYSEQTVAAVNKYKSDVEAELKERSAKLVSAKEKIDAEAKKAEGDKNAAEAQIKAVTEKIAALTGIFDSFAGQFDSVNEQIGKVTSQINSVTDSFGSVTKQITSVTGQFDAMSEQITSATAKISDTSKQMCEATKQIGEASKQLDGFAESFESAKTGISGMSKAVTDTKNSIDNVKQSVNSAKEAAEGQKASAIDTAALTSAAADLSVDFSSVSAKLELPVFDTAKFSKARLDDIKKKLKVETSYEGGEAAVEEEEEFLDDSEIISSIQVDSVATMPSDEELMADTPDVVSTPELSEAAPVEVAEEKAVATPSAPKEEKAEMSSDFEDFFVTAPSATPLENRAGVGAIEGFTLEKEPEPAGADFDIAPNDLTAKPDKGADLGDDIFDMAINPVGADDDTLSNMMADAEAAARAGDFELTPSNINANAKDDTGSNDMSSDFGEFADLFAAGSAETTAPTEKKGKAPFRQTTSTSDDDLWNFGSDSKGDDSDLTADSDLSDLLL